MQIFNLPKAIIIKTASDYQIYNQYKKIWTQSLKKIEMSNI